MEVDELATSLGLDPIAGVFGALGVSSGPTGTTDAAWNGPAAEKALSNDAGKATYRKAYAWVDPDGDPDKKASYAFIHHVVTDGSTVGAANLKACSSGIGILNGGRGVSGGAWSKDRQGIYNHLAAHLKAGGTKPGDLPPLKDHAVAEARDNAFDWVVQDLIAHGRDPNNAMALAPEIVDAMSEAELLDQFAVGRDLQTPDPERLFHLFMTNSQSTGNTGTQLSGAYTVIQQWLPSLQWSDENGTHHPEPVDLGARLAGWHQVQAEHPEVALTAVEVALTADGEAVQVPLAIRWDDAAADFLATGDGLLAAGAAPLVDNPGAPWHAVLCVEGLPTDEDPARLIMPGAVQFPDLPVSLRLQVHDEGGHYGAVTCGRIDTMERQELDGYNAIYATGTFGTDEHGQLAQLLVQEQTQRFISIDGRNTSVQEVTTTRTVQDAGGGILPGLYDDDAEPQGEVVQWYQFNEITIGAATIVATPALQQAVITLASQDLPETPIAVGNAADSGIAASAAPGEPQLPPLSAFADPEFFVGDPRLVRQPDGKYACPLTVTSDGRVYGHMAHWGQEHTGMPGQEVTPPHSPTYAYFMDGARLTAEGMKVAVGNLTMGCGHASTTISDPLAAKSHYRNPAHYDGGYGAVQMADVCAGEDDFGIWFAGVLCEDVTPEQVRKFESMGLSGDWRKIAGTRHLVACLAVPVSGFPQVREPLSLVASASELLDGGAVLSAAGDDGEPYALVAAGRVYPVPPDERLAYLERGMQLLLDDLATRRKADALAQLESVV